MDLYIYYNREEWTVISKFTLAITSFFKQAEEISVCIVQSIVLWTKMTKKERLTQIFILFMNKVQKVQKYFHSCIIIYLVKKNGQTMFSPPKKYNLTSFLQK